MSDQSDPGEVRGSFYIVAVDSFDGDEGTITVTDRDGAPLKSLYCVASRDEASGVLQIVDYGYRTAQAARVAWPEAT